MNIFDELMAEVQNWPWWKKFYYACRRGLSNSTYWIRCHIQPSYRFHFLDLRNKHYSHGWTDVDYQMMYACFNLLRSFVEKEDGLINMDYQWQHFEEENSWKEYGFCSLEEALKGEEYLCRKELAVEARFLYDWWMNTWNADSRRPGDEKYEEETEMLLRLIRIRSALWT